MKAEFFLPPFSHPGFRIYCQPPADTLLPFNWKTANKFLATL